MPTTDTTPALRYLRTLKHKSRVIPDCQDRFAGRSGSSSSPYIFILNFGSPYRDRLALRLRQLRYEIFVPETQGITLSELRDQAFERADFILFDLTNLNHDDVWVPLRRICRLRKPDGMPLMVHCFSRVDRGSEFHLMVEKLGARLDYYAE
jgi:hypothetical protein